MFTFQIMLDSCYVRLTFITTKSIRRKLYSCFRGLRDLSMMMVLILEREAGKKDKHMVVLGQMRG